MKRPLDASDLQSFMQRNRIAGEIMRLSVPTPTVESAAQAVGTTPQRIVKSLLFLIDGQPVLVIACGVAPVSRQTLAQLYGVSPKKVKLAPAETVLQVSGYAVGSMPPFGHLQKLPTLIDPTVLQQPEVYAGGGAENALVRLPSTELLRATQAKVVPLLAPTDIDPS